MNKRTNKLIPNGDYFKRTTRVFLTEAEKQEILDSVDRALNYLFEMSEQMEYKSTSYADGREGLQIIVNKRKYLSRCLHLVKGGTQPRYLYNYDRKVEIYNEARQIAKETGAPFEEVKQEFLELMDKYISK